MRDPNNPRYVSERGVDYSVITRDGSAVVKSEGPEHLAGRRVRFSYQGEPGQSVSLVGSFNHWDPFSHRLQEKEGGRYSITMDIGPGDHAYAFMVDGIQVGDPENPERSVDDNGKTINILSISP
jgi:1,4-alpha-glucan branching enzyme